MLTKSSELKLLLALIACAVVLSAVDSVPVKNPRSVSEENSSRPRDDLTTAFAKQIMRLSKAAEIHGLLNTKVDPCDDFYQHACGNWHRSNPAQLLKHITTDKFQLIARAFNRRLELILDEPRDQNVLENKVKDFYQACQLVKKDDIQYKLALQSVYKEYGDLPVLLGEDWKEENFIWWEVIAKIQHKYGKQIILAVDIMGDIKNNTENMIYVGPPDYSIAANTKVLSVLQEAGTVAALQQFFGIEHSLAKDAAKEMIELERALVQGGTDSRLGLSLQELLHLEKVENLKVTYEDNLDLKRYLELVLGENVPESIYIYDEKYFESMLQTVKEKPRRVLANYIIWQLLQEYLVEPEKGDASKWCIEKTKKYFGKFVDHMVYLRYKDEQVEKEVYEVWEEIRSTFREELRGDKLDWIANATREYSIEKLDAMELHINSYESEDFASELGNLSISRRNYVENVQHILMQESDEKLRKLHQPASALEAPQVLSFTPAYNILENNIKIPVALLQPRFFWDANYPQSLKYATLGYLIAHEMVHGFDDDGRNYDKLGNQRSWWDYKSTYEFDSRRKCFQAQYHNYKYGGHQLPDDVSQSENIADNAGVKLAYAAYVRWLGAQKHNNTEVDMKEVLPGLNFDSHQLFFVAFAQLWCDDVQTFFKTSVASADSHAPSMYRVIGSLSNFQEFSWVFKCKPDAPMDPEFKCSIY